MELGAVADGAGTRFTVRSPVAERIEVCLFGPDGAESDRVDLTVGDDHLWSAHVGGVGPGSAYGFRVHGSGNLSQGHACDPAKLLVDPLARKLTGELTWARELLTPGVDSAPYVPRSIVALPLCPVDPGERPGTPWEESFIYEAHVGHLTARHGLVPLEHRGRYGGLAADAVIDHLRHLGVTAIELMPVQHFVSERQLAAEGRRNVWGYNPLAWGAPHGGYASAGGDPVAELRQAVSDLHEAGIEVWLDVVFNHTCEGALGSGPVLSWRGFDNAAYYRLLPAAGGVVDDDLTGCGNTIDTRSVIARQLIRQCLVRWVTEFGIDGFRFDLAGALIRADDGPTADHPLLAELAADPALATTKLVAEPWDAAGDGYCLGRFGSPWREWNDRFRDGIRDLWRGQSSWADGAARLTGSADVFRSNQRPATSSINAVATHDGFTLADLVTYGRPTEGGHDQRSSNGGLEGPTADPAVLALRARRQRAMLATALLSQGVPMVAAGDEMGRSQGGRTDGYTLEPSEWGLPWPDADRDLVDWVGTAAEFRRTHLLVRRPEWIDEGSSDVAWLDPGGQPMDGEDWAAGERRGLQVLLRGPEPDGAPVLMLFVAGTDNERFELPPGSWRISLHTDWARGRPDVEAPDVEGALEIWGPALVVLTGLAGTDPVPG